jgi:endogenous inhibitor of DNA gyrase (YacG/DUF329 family)
MSQLTPTAYQVICPLCGPVNLTEENYTRQMMQPDIRWHCPACGSVAEWDDDWFEEFEDREKTL